MKFSHQGSQMMKVMWNLILILYKPSYLNISFGNLDKAFYLRPGYEYSFEHEQLFEIMYARSKLDTDDSVYLRKLGLSNDIWAHFSRHSKGISGKIKDSFYEEIPRLIDDLNVKYADNEIDEFRSFRDLTLAKWSNYTFRFNAAVTEFENVNEDWLTGENGEIDLNQPYVVDYLRSITDVRIFANNFRKTGSIEKRDKYASYVEEANSIESSFLRDFALLSLIDKAFDPETIWSPELDRLNEDLNALIASAKSAQIRQIATDLKSLHNGFRAGEVSDFIVNDREGNSVSLNEHFGVYTLLDFWFVGCVYCEKEINDLKSLMSRHQNLKVLSIDDIDNLDRMNGFLEKKNRDWTFLNASDNQEINSYFAVNGYPYYVLIGPDNKVLHTSNSIKADKEILMI